MASSSYIRRKIKRMSERGRHNGRLSAKARERRAAECTDPVRETRVIEITIRDTHRPMRIIRLQQEEGAEGHWSRFRVEGLSCRPLGVSGIAGLIARCI